MEEWCFSTRLHVYTPTPPRFIPLPGKLLLPIHAPTVYSLAIVTHYTASAASSPVYRSLLRAWRRPRPGQCGVGSNNSADSRACYHNECTDGASIGCSVCRRCLHVPLRLDSRPQERQQRAAATGLRPDSDWPAPFTSDGRPLGLQFTCICLPC